MRFPMPRTVGAKIGATVTVVLIASALSIGAGLEGLRRVAVPLEDLVKVNSVKSDAVSDMRFVIAARAATVRNIALTSEVNKMAGDQAELTRLSALYAARLDVILALPLDPRESAILAAAKAHEAEAGKYMRDALAMARSLQADVAAEVLVEKLSPVQKLWLADLDQLLAYEANARTELLATAQNTRSLAVLTMLVGGVLATVIGAASTWFLSRGIARRLRAAVTATDSITSGNLTVGIDTAGVDEVAELLRAVARMQEHLLHTVSGIQHTAESIRTASTEIAVGTSDLSSRTEQQAANLQQAAASMQQMTQAVQTNADSARSASAMAAQASDVAESGGAAVAKVVLTMQDIQSSSRRIADIIGVIDSIAFQTNILALNAAVEAARAGEQGRGFAVVATEVRLLAKRSADAAKEIKELVEASVTTVAAGHAEVAVAGATIAKVVDQVKGVTKLIAQISSASSEQTATIGQISSAVAQLDNMTQQNAALVEESTAAAESLRDQTGNLARAIEVFKTA